MVGLTLTVRVGLPVLWMSLAGGLILFFYTTPPISLNFRGLGELSLFLCFGPLLVLGIYFVLTGRLAWEPVVAALPLGLLTMNVGNISAVFDYPSDLATHKRSFAVKWGQPAAVRLIGLFAMLGFLSIPLGVMGGLLPSWSLLGLLTLPLAVQAVLRVRRYADLTGYPLAMGWAVATTPERAGC
ncbi:membrane hypothetical protein [Gammaproteobacteria bacterium]